MKTISEYKNMALGSLEGNWARSAMAVFIVTLIIPAGAVILNIFSLLLLPLSWGLTVFFLNLIREEDIRFERLFDGFKQFFRIFLAILLKNIYIALWSLLLFIPGIIKYYSYAMTDFILKDNLEIGSDEAICQSMEMMQGHKMKLFMLDLSMIGWAILCLCTFGIGFYFLYPYNYSAHAHFYEDLKAEYDNNVF